MSARCHQIACGGKAGSMALGVCLMVFSALSPAPGAANAAVAAGVADAVDTAEKRAEIVHAQFESEPHRLIQETSERLLRLIEESRGYVEEDSERFLGAVDALLTPVLDFTGFARGVMSAHYRKATAEQRKRFAESFKTSLLRTYAMLMTKFGAGQVTVLPPDKPRRRPDRRNVRMEIRTSGGSVHPVVYTMRLGEDGAWRIGNIVVAGVNIGLTFRSQFKSAVSGVKYGGDLDRVIDAWAGVVAGKPPGEGNGSTGA